MPPLDFSTTIERFTGFGSAYNEVRPSAPETLAELLLPMAGRRTQPAELIVDLGCGTGLSTRYWSPYARAIIGVEPTASMREEAERIGGENLSYIEGFSHSTGLPDACADLVICAQSLHWMEPFGTFTESARILGEGGVFAAYDYDWPPSTTFWEVDSAYTECMTVARQLEHEHGITGTLNRWDKEGHLARMKQSQCFRFVRETLLHHRERGGAERIVGVLLSQGHVQSLLKLGVTEQELKIPHLREAAQRAFGSTESQWFWSARVRIGIK